MGVEVRLRIRYRHLDRGGIIEFFFDRCFGHAAYGLQVAGVHEGLQPLMKFAFGEAGSLRQQLRFARRTVDQLEQKQLLLGYTFALALAGTGQQTFRCFAIYGRPSHIKVLYTVTNLSAQDLRTFRN